MNTEIWKDVKGYEGQYQISNLGTVKSVSRIISYGKASYLKPELIMKDRLTKTGYLQIGLTKNNKVKFYFIHRLIAIAFIPNPENKSMINHRNGIKTDNRIENLEWCTCQENNIHAIQTGLNPMKEFHRNNKQIFCKPVKQISIEGEFIKMFESGIMASRELKIPYSSIYKVLKGERTFAGGFRWSRIR